MNNSLLRETPSGKIEYYASSNPENFKKHAKMFLDIKQETKLITI